MTLTKAAVNKMIDIAQCNDKAVKPVNHLIIYHAISPGVACDDGFGAAWAAHKGLSITNSDESIVLYEGIYGKEPNYELIGPNTRVHILDFSYPVQVLNVIAARALSVTLLDHHKSAMDRWEKEKSLYAYCNKSFIQFDMTRSGAMMAWNHYVDEISSAPSLIAHIQDNDLWKFGLANTKSFIEALRSYPQTLLDWNTINLKTSDTAKYLEFVQEGETINRYYQQKLKELIIYTKQPCIINGISGLCCNAPKMFASDIGNILARESGIYGASWFAKNDGSIEWSLRSASDFDVSEVAKLYGGGGHQKAAGFSLLPNRTKQLMYTSDRYVTIERPYE